jgi:hypothetical protein
LVNAVYDVPDSDSAALRWRQGELVLFLVADPPESGNQLRAVKITRGVPVIYGVLNRTAN